MEKNDPEMFKLVTAENEADEQARQLADQYRAAAKERPRSSRPTYTRRSPGS